MSGFMPSASEPPSSSGGPAPVVGPQYCVPYPVDLRVTKKAVKDANGNIMFKVKGVDFSFHPRWILRDDAGNALLAFRKKMWSMHNRWEVFRGESTNPGDLLFSVKESSMFQLRRSLDVFLAGNDSSEKVCDFKVKGSYWGRSCTVYLGESDNIVAQYTVTNVLCGKPAIGVRVYPHVDCAFIVALVVILDEMDSSQKSHHHHHHHHHNSA